jgi:hypothetical protein
MRQDSSERIKSGPGKELVSLLGSLPNHSVVNGSLLAGGVAVAVCNMARGRNVGVCEALASETVRVATVAETSLVVVVDATRGIIARTLLRHHWVRGTGLRRMPDD